MTNQITATLNQIAEIEEKLTFSKLTTGKRNSLKKELAYQKELLSILR